MSYGIFITGLFLLLLAKGIQPVHNWWASFNVQRGMSALLVLSIFATFITGTGAETGGIPSGSRLFRFIVIMVVFFWALKVIVPRIDKIRYAGVPTFFMVLYGLYCMLSAVYSVDAFITAWKGMEVFTLVLVSVAVATHIETMSDIRQYISILCVIILFFVITVFLGVVFKPDEAFTKMASSSALVVRGLGPLMNSNTVTQMCALLAMLVLPIALNGKKEKARLAWIIFVLGMVMMVLGHSRTSIFACSLAFSGVLYFSGRRLVSVALVAGGGLSVLFLEFVLVYIYRGQSAEHFSTFTGRVDWWAKAYEIVEQSPMFGHGFYAAQRLMLGSGTVDSTYFDILIGLGYTGLLIVAIPIIITTVRLFATRPVKNESSESQIIWLQLWSIFVLLMVRSITGTTFQVLHPNLVLWGILLVSVEAYARFKRQGDPVVMPDNEEPQAETQIQDDRILRRKRNASSSLGEKKR